MCLACLATTHINITNELYVYWTRVNSDSSSIHTLPFHTPLYSPISPSTQKLHLFTLLLFISYHSPLHFTLSIFFTPPFTFYPLTILSSIMLFNSALFVLLLESPKCYSLFLDSLLKFFLFTQIYFAFSARQTGGLPINHCIHSIKGN